MNWPFPCGNGHNLKWPFKITIATEHALRYLFLFIKVGEMVASEGARCELNSFLTQLSSLSLMSGFCFFPDDLTLLTVCQISLSSEGLCLCHLDDSSEWICISHFA